MPKQPSVRAGITRSKAHLIQLRSILKCLALSISIGYHPEYLSPDPDLCRTALVWVDRVWKELFDIETQLRRKRAAK